MTLARITPNKIQGRPAAAYGATVRAAKRALQERGPLTMRELVVHACLTVETAKNVVKQGKAKGWLVECGRHKHANGRRWVAVYELDEDRALFEPNAVRETPDGMKELTNVLAGWR